MPGKEVGQCRVTPVRFKYIGKRGLGSRVIGFRAIGFGVIGFKF